ncbi:hypothetical protein RRG08_057627 [Elysia crispata]|uniref:Uncharacterized protein n=1 Tax=Elysia crispata TaxID=231223 RepID=A0AAE1A230_9GAST|nr:hypothetical protein RRG08_057627 [Elysia crispata]
MQRVLSVLMRDGWYSNSETLGCPLVQQFNTLGLLRAVAGSNLTAKEDSVLATALKSLGDATVLCQGSTFARKFWASGYVERRSRSVGHRSEPPSLTRDKRKGQFASCSNWTVGTHQEIFDLVSPPTIGELGLCPTERAAVLVVGGTPQEMLDLVSLPAIGEVGLCPTERAAVLVVGGTPQEMLDLVSLPAIGEVGLCPTERAAVLVVGHPK